MNAKSIPMFSSVLWQYYDAEELFQLSGIFSVEVPAEAGTLTLKGDFLAFSKMLLLGASSGNNWALLETLLEEIEGRNIAAIANTSWETRTMHESLRPTVRKLQDEFKELERGSEIAVIGQRPFVAKAEIREFLEQATTDVLIVDPYIGQVTLDCLRLVNTSIRLLTATGGKAIEIGFATALADFVKEGRIIEVRQVTGLHDRHFSFNGRCWLVGSSLKDAGTKAFNCTEIVDSKAEVVTHLETSWQSGKVFP